MSGDAPSRVLVLGGDASGMTAASHLRRRLPEAEIVVIERGSHTSYSMCGIPYLVGGEIGEPEQLVVRTPEQFRAAAIAVRTGTEAVAIDSAGRRVRTRDVVTGAERQEPYDVLLYAIGAHPATPPVPGAKEYGVVVHTLDEGEALRNGLDAVDRERGVAEGGRGGERRNVVVVGAGYIGMEIAEALVRRGLHAILLDRNTQVMGSLDPDMAWLVAEGLQRFGVELHLGETLTEVRGASGRVREVVTDMGTYPADLLVIATGARPNVELAETAGCKVGDSGALVVDERMRTSVEGIWAAGDCVESLHMVSGRRVNVQLGTHANKQGKVAGIDMVAVLAGEEGGDAAFPGLVGTAVTRICEAEVARTGLNEKEARAAGVDYRVVRFEGTATSGYLPDPGKVTVKMLAEPGTGRVLGAQLVGSGNVAKRIDTAAMWCQLGVTVQQAQFLDLSYAPPFGSVWDLLQTGARKLVRELGLSPVL